METLRFSSTIDSKYTSGEIKIGKKNFKVNKIDLAHKIFFKSLWQSIV